MKILAVDDDVLILELLPTILAKAGFADVSLARSGETALELIETAAPAFDCLMLDIQMPGMDGIELCARIRQMPAHRKTPIIMLTSMTDRDSIDRAFAAGATDYVTKPLDTLELRARIGIAEELVTARREAAGISPAPQTGSHPNLDADASAISQAEQISGVRELIDNLSLTNYLKQLARAGLLGSQVIVIKVDNIERIHARASNDEFTRVLTEVAEAISNTLGAQGFLMADAGNGLFVCASSSPDLLVPEGLETAIQSLLDESDAAYGDGTPIDIEVSVGKSVRPATSTSNDVDKVLDRAVASAENRFQQKKNTPRQPTIRRMAGPH